MLTSMAIHQEYAALEKQLLKSPPESLRLPITDIKSDHITEERTVTALEVGVDGGGGGFNFAMCCHQTV